MDKSKLKECFSIIDDMPTAGNNILYYEQLPQYDLFLSQVVDFLNASFPEANYTTNIIQNYIKNEVISAPLGGKKRGYTRQHIIQLILVSYMRPLLTSDEIKKVFALAFNNINSTEDDIITWDMAYKFFTKIQQDSLSGPLSFDIPDPEALSGALNGDSLDSESRERLKVFLTVMTLIARASTTKILVQKIVNRYASK